MADSPQDEGKNQTEARVTGTHTGPVAVEQGRDVDGDGSEKLEYGNPAEDTSKLPTDVYGGIPANDNDTQVQQPEQ